MSVSGLPELLIENGGDGMTPEEALSVLIRSDRMWEGITRKERMALNLAIVALEKLEEYERGNAE